MRIAYFDCSAGIAGDMVLGALVDAGLSLDRLKAELARLPLDGWEVTAEDAKRGALVGTKVNVEVTERQPHRHLADIYRILDDSSLEAHVVARVKEVFRALGEAEARMHGVSLEKVHFHEVGAVDAIVDIVGAVAGLDLLRVDRVCASPLNVGAGTVEAAHGRLPVPAPATAELLKRLPSYGSEVDAELVTPTGAALVKSLCSRFGPQPAMRVEQIGYGAGARELPFPNLLRVSIGEETNGAGADAGEAAPLAGRAAFDEVDLLEANIDDANPEWIGDAVDHLLRLDGVLDVWQNPVWMKKGRIGTLVTVIARPDATGSACEALFRQTSTLGVRKRRVQRVKLERDSIRVRLPWGDLTVKVGRLGREAVNVAPEYEEAKRLAHGAGVPLKQVYQSAVAAGWARAGRPAPTA